VQVSPQRFGPRRPPATLLAAASSARVLLERVLRVADAAVGVEAQLVHGLTTEWEGRLPDAYEAALDVLDEGPLDDPVAEADIGRLLVAVEPALVAGWAAATKRPATTAVEDAYLLGRAGMLLPLREEVDWTAVDERAQAHLASDTLYWIGNAWSNELGGALASVIRAEVIEKGLSRREAGAALEAIFGKVFPARSRAYWNVVAAAGVVRSRTYGTVASFEQAGVETFEYVAVLDNRTSALCEHMNGRIFRVDVAVRQRDAFLEAESPEEAKAAHPWPKPTEVLGMDTKALEAAGICLPPLHGSCRSVVVPSAMEGST
jgi:SPP1 gp7 family putative phage head morphogenesis protein